MKSTLIMYFTYANIHEMLLQHAINVNFYIYLFIYLLATPCGLQDLSSLTRDRTYAACSGSEDS